MSHVPMKKGFSKNSHTENTFESQYENEHNHARPSNQQNIAITSLNLNSVDSNVTTGLDSANDKKIIKQPKRNTDPSKSTELYNVKLTARIRETFLIMKNKTIEESPNCVELLKNYIPFDEPNEAFLVTDPFLLLQYIKQIFDKTLELKVDAEQVLDARNDNECGDYEAMLQKLEAEVRQHIRIEQQLKLYVESVQSKLDEQEKEGGDMSRLLDIQKEMEGLQQENIGLNAKVKVYEEEIHNLKKKLARKIASIEKLERQIENIPVLKRMVKEMDKILDGGQPLKSVNESLLKGSQRSSKEADLHGVSISSHMNDPRARKSSQAAVSSTSQERKSYDKNRESSEYIRIVDASMQVTKDGKREKHSAPPQRERDDDYSRKTSGRRQEDDLKRPRKSSKGDSNRQSHSRERHSDSEAYGLDNTKEMKALLHAKMKEDMIEPSKFSYDAALKAGMEEYLRKSLDRSDIKPKKHNKTDTSATKKTKAQVIESLKEKADNLRVFGHKNSISKSRPGTVGDRHHDQVQHSAEHFSESFKQQRDTSSNSIKKAGHDRSQSVDPKKKLLRQHKSRGSINEEDSEMEGHKKQSSFSGHSKGVGSSKVNNSVLTKSHS